MKSIEERFAYLFRGYTKHYTTVRLDPKNKRIEDKGDKGKKVVGRTKTESERPLQLIDYAEHLAGRKYGIGVIPLTEELEVFFGAIDIDTYGLTDKQLFELDDKIRAERWPFIVCRTKSGGAHLLMFFKEAMTPKVVKEAMEYFAGKLGYGDTDKSEVFPKQTNRVIDPTIDRKDIGTALNLPYFNHTETDRYAVFGGHKLTLEEFLIMADELMVKDETALMELIKASDPVDSLFADGPHCLRNIEAAGGFPDGTRNNGMFNVAVYLKLKFGDKWRDKLTDYNEKMCKPKLSFDELTQLAGSVEKTEYAYMCKQAPIVKYCSKQLCKKQKYGISALTSKSEYGEMPDITSVTMCIGDPTYWFIDIADARLVLTDEQLQNQTLFNRACMGKRLYPGTMPKMKWEKFLRELIKNAAVTYAPEDASPSGQLRILLEKFCYGNMQAKELKDILTDRVYFEEIKPGKIEDYETYEGAEEIIELPITTEPRYQIIFKSSSLFSYLKKVNFKYESEHRIWLYLKEHFNAKKAKRHIYGTSNHKEHVWIINDFEPEKRKEVKHNSKKAELEPKPQVC